MHTLSPPRARRCSLSHLRLHICTIVFVLSFLFILWFELDHPPVASRDLIQPLPDRLDKNKYSTRTRWPPILAELKTLIPLRLLAHLNTSSFVDMDDEKSIAIRASQSPNDGAESMTLAATTVPKAATEIIPLHAGLSSEAMAPAASSHRIPTFTIVSLLRDMIVPDAGSSQWDTEDVNAVRYSIQMNALCSWQRLLGGQQFNSFILIFMDSEQSCRNLIQMGARVQNASESLTANVFDGIRCLPIPCWDPESKRPLLHCLFDKAHSVAETQMMLYVNGDIILNPHLRRRLDFVEKDMRTRGYEKLMAVGRRIDFPLSKEFITSSIPSETTIDQMISHANRQGAVHGEFGLDVFFYSKNIFAPIASSVPASFTPIGESQHHQHQTQQQTSTKQQCEQIQFPPFLAGVFRWDNWLLAECILRGTVETIDLAPNLPPGDMSSSTPVIEPLILHQNDPIRSGHRTRAGAETNEQLARQRSNTDYMYGTTTNCKWQLRVENPCQASRPCADRTSSGEEESQTMVPNTSQSLQLQFRQVSTKSRTLIAFPISQQTFQRSLFDLYLCQIARSLAPLTNAIFIVDTTDLADEIRRRLVEWKQNLTLQRGVRHSNLIPTPVVFAMPNLPNDGSVDVTTSRRKLGKLNPLFQFLFQHPPSGTAQPESSLVFDLFYLNFLRHIQSNSFHVLHCDMFASSFSGSPTVKETGDIAVPMKSGLVWSGNWDLLSHLDQYIQGKGRPVDLVVIKQRLIVQTEFQLSASQPPASQGGALRQPIPLNPSLVLIQSSKMAQYWLSLSKECIEQHLIASSNQQMSIQAPTANAGSGKPVLSNKSACMSRAYEKLHASQLVSLEFDLRRFPCLRNTSTTNQVSKEIDMWIDNRMPMITYSDAAVNDSELRLQEAQLARWKVEKLIDTVAC